MKEKINYEMWVYALKIFGDTSFAFTYEEGETGERLELYWPHLFYVKYKNEKLYEVLTEDYENSCYLISQIWMYVCYRYDHGVEGVDIEPLVKFAIGKKGGVDYRQELSCEQKKAKLLELQEYIYGREPTWKTKKFYYNIIISSIA